MLLTRPLAQSHAFGDALLGRLGDRVRLVISPLLSPEFLVPDLPNGPFTAVIFTSATGVEAAGQLPIPKCAYCVSGQTAAAARSAGFQALSADGDAEALIRLVLAKPPAGRLLHLRGEESRGDIAERLTLAGIETGSAIVYRQITRPLTTEALDLLSQDAAVVVPLFSAKTAAAFRKSLPADLRAGLRIAAISEAVAEMVEGLRYHGLEVARRPDAEAMLEAVAHMVQLRPPP